MIRAKRAREQGDDDPMKQLIQKTLGKHYDPAKMVDDTPITFGGYHGNDDWEDEAFVVNRRVVSATEFKTGVRRNGKEITEAEKATAIQMRSMIVDHQENGFYLVVRSWAYDDKISSRKKFHAEVRTWAELDIVAARYGIHKSLIFVDCGNANDEFWEQMKKRGWRALRGDKRHKFPWKVKVKLKNGKEETRIVEKPYSQRDTFGNSELYGVPVYYFSNLVFKDRLDR